MKIFVDSDVVVSSLISKTGASYFLLNEPIEQTELMISNYSKKELQLVVKKMNLSQKKLKKTLKGSNLFNLRNNSTEIKKSHNKYVSDLNDAHIVAAAEESGSKILLTYNQRHYRREKIKRDLNIIVMTPGQFLQHLRSKK